MQGKMQPRSAIGFIGLGVMGEPMCRNLALKSNLPVTAYDLMPEPIVRLESSGVRPSKSIGEVLQNTDIIFLSLPSGAIVKQIAFAEDGLLAHAKQHAIVDLSTSPISLTKSLANDFAKTGSYFFDAPVARTRQAAEDGTLSIMVGGQENQLKNLHPLLACMATDITYCGSIGLGQAAKILNNMVLFQTVSALSEALAMGDRLGFSRQDLLGVLSKGSANSFALNNHGMKAMVPGQFPEKAFSVNYAKKDLEYALELAAELNTNCDGAQLVMERFNAAIEKGLAEQYFPVISKLWE